MAAAENKLDEPVVGLVSDRIESVRRSSFIFAAQICPPDLMPGGGRWVA